MSGNKIPFPETKEWFKIEHLVGISGTIWLHALFQGFPSHFESLEVASQRLKACEQFPQTTDVMHEHKWQSVPVQYRIVKVTEEVVHES